MTFGARAEAAEDEPAIDEETVVTGSPIRRDPLDARESVLNIVARDRDRTGLTWLGDMLGRLPVSGSSLNTRFNSSGNFGFPAKPAWKSSLTVDRKVAGWRLSWGMRYIHAVTESCSDFLDGTPASLTNLDLCSIPNRRDNSASRNRLGTTVYHDAQPGYERASTRGTLTLVLGLNNAFNRDPPPSRSAPLNGYDPSLYDIPGGRLGYLRVAYGTRP